MQDATFIATSHIPLLLTPSVVAYDSGIAFRNTQECIRLTLVSVREWLSIRLHSAIVLCDSSNYDFSKAVKRYFPNARIKCLTFENPQELVQQLSRGFGEVDY